MKMFEQVSSTMGSQRDDVKSMPQKMNSSANGVKCQPALGLASFEAHANGGKMTGTRSYFLGGGLVGTFNANAEADLRHHPMPHEMPSKRFRIGF